MNKKVSIILIILALALIAYNVTIIDFEDPLGEQSIIAVIGVVAALIAIVLLLILIASRKISDTLEDK
jgi:hypothetical protein